MEPPRTDAASETSFHGTRIEMLAGLVAVSLYVVGSRESGMSIVSGMTAFLVWGFAALISIGGIIAVARAALRRELRPAMALASCSLFLCTTALIAFKLSRFIQ
jgi:hypothetical protein